MRMQKIFLIAVILLSFTGCAALREMWCNTNAAYNAGVGDGKAHKGKRSNYASNCSENIIAINPLQVNSVH